MTQLTCLDELTKPDALALLASLRRLDPGLPDWMPACAIFADPAAQVAQDRILRALLAAYRIPDLRAGPLIIALLWRRICAKAGSDDDQVQTLVAGVLEMARFTKLAAAGLPMRLISAAAERTRQRGPTARTVPLSELNHPTTPPREPSMADDDLLTPTEAAKRLKLKNPITLARWAKAGHLIAKRTPTGRYRYSVQEIERIIAEKKGGGA